MIIDILSGFPEMLSGALNSSILKGALLDGLCRIWVHDLRYYTTERHGKIDDTPYGGGPGMILAAQPVFACLDDLKQTRQSEPYLIFMSPQGETLTQARVEGLRNQPWIVLLCGHYKDIDARVFERDSWHEISIGDYVLSGGELAAAVLVDAIVRRLENVLGDDLSAETDSFSDGLLDAPYYTKPEEIAGMKVPDVLLSGHHRKITDWRQEQRESRTQAKRPDLWERYRTDKQIEKKNK